MASNRGTPDKSEYDSFLFTSAGFTSSALSIYLASGISPPRNPRSSPEKKGIPRVEMLAAADFVALPPSAYSFIIWNLFLTDKLTPLCEKELKENNIEEIVAILPSAADFEPFVSNIGSCGYRVLAYGDEHIPTLPVAEYDKVAELIDSLARNKSENGAKRNVLLFCNNGYQRSLPFLVYYMKKFHGDEFPTTERALSVILSAIRKSDEMEGYLKALSSLPL